MANHPFGPGPNPIFVPAGFCFPAVNQSGGQAAGPSLGTVTEDKRDERIFAITSNTASKTGG